MGADTVAPDFKKIVLTHSYITKRFLSDLGTTFTYNLMHELKSLPKIQINHATLKHLQTYGLIERSHGALKKILKLNTEDQWSDWHR